MDSPITEKKLKALEILYIASSILLFSAVVFIPFLIGHDYLLTQKIVIEEDVLEALLIGVLLLAAYILSRFYKREINKYRQKVTLLECGNSNLSGRLTDAFKYIGVVNVELQQIRSIFSGIKGYPVTKSEFNRLLLVFVRTILEITKAEWAVVRIIKRDNFRTIKEKRESRRHTNLTDYRISNKAIILNQKIDGYSIVGSRQNGLTIKAACILPKKGIGMAEKIFIEAVANQIEMHYIIYRSKEAKKEYLRQKREFDSHRLQSAPGGGDPQKLDDVL